MNRLAILIAAGVLALAACTAAPRTPAQAVFALEASYDGALSGVVAYAMLPRCAEGGPVVCSEPAVVRQVNETAHRAWVAIRAAQAIAVSYRPDATALANATAAAVAALGELTSLTAAFASPATQGVK
jgi:hypothetical protein